MMIVIYFYSNFCLINLADYGFAKIYLLIVLLGYLYIYYMLQFNADGRVYLVDCSML